MYKNFDDMLFRFPTNSWNFLGLSSILYEFSMRPISFRAYIALLVVFYAWTMLFTFIETTGIDWSSIF